MPLLLTVEMNVANKTNYSDYSPSVSTSFRMFSAYLCHIWYVFFMFPSSPCFFFFLIYQWNLIQQLLIGRAHVSCPMSSRVSKCISVYDVLHCYFTQQLLSDKLRLVTLAVCVCARVGLYVALCVLECVFSNLGVKDGKSRRPGVLI